MKDIIKFNDVSFLFKVGLQYKDQYKKSEIVVIEWLTERITNLILGRLRIEYERGKLYVSEKGNIILELTKEQAMNVQNRSLNYRQYEEISRMVGRMNELKIVEENKELRII